MKIIKARDGMLTNAEVLWRVNEIKQQQLTSELGASPDNLEIVISELQVHLQQRPAGNDKSPQSAENISQFMTALRSSGIFLEKAEVLQIINSAPSSLPVLYTLVEECEERFTDQQSEHLLELCSQYLGYEPSAEVEEGS